MNEFAKNNAKRNSTLFFIENIVACNMMILIGPWSIIPFLMEKFGATTMQVGLVNSLLNFSFFAGALIYSYLSTTVKRKGKWMFRVNLIGKGIFFATVLAIPSIYKSNPQMMISLFLIAWVAYNILNTGDTFYYPLLAKVVPENMQGRIYGWGSTAGYVVGLISTFFVGKAIANFEFPINYVMILSAGCVIAIIQAIIYALIKEEDEVLKEKINYGTFFKNMLSEAISNKKFLHLMMGYIFIQFLLVNLNYYSLYSIKILNAPDSAVAIFTTLLVIAPMLGTFIFGFANDKLGIRNTHLLMASFGIIASIIVILFPNILAVYIALVFTRMVLSGFYCSTNITICKITTIEKRPALVGVNGMVINVVSSIITILGALIIDKYSYTALFTVTCIGGIFAFIIFMLFKETANSNQL